MDKIAASIAQIAAEVSAKADTAADMPAALNAALDAWIADQPDPKLSRPDAIRQILTEHLKAEGFLSNYPGL